MKNVLQDRKSETKKTVRNDCYIYKHLKYIVFIIGIHHVNTDGA